MTVSTDMRFSRRRVAQASAAAALMSTIPAVHMTSAQATDQETWDREADVVVVGSGAAGTPAALEAARAGANVLLLEKAEGPGGNMAHAEGIIYLGGGTELQKRHGVEDTVEGMIAYLEDFMHPFDDAEFIRFYAENAAEHYDWLAGEGVPFGDRYLPIRTGGPADAQGGLHFCGNELNYPSNQVTEPVARGHSVVGYGAGMAAALLDSVEAEPNITLELNAPATQLIVNETGRVIGVGAEIGGVEQRVAAHRGVVLAAGGYEMNESMLENTLAQSLDLIPAGSVYRTNTGDTLRMGAGLGARLRNMDQTASFSFVYSPEERTQAVLVGGNGRRFQNESDYGAIAGQHLVYELNDTAFLIADQTIVDTVEAVDGVMGEPIATADTLEELAEAIGVPVEVFTAEIAFYNEHAAEGNDPLFHKAPEFLSPLETAPFYAYPFSAVAFITTGHMEIDLETRVIDYNGQAIPGLYAAGQNGVGVGRRFYNSGIRLGEGSMFGRVAGRTAAAAEPWSEGTATPIEQAASTPVATAEEVSEEQAATPVADESLDNADVVVVAVDIAYEQDEITIAADTDVVIGLVNEGFLPHDIAVEDTDYVSSPVNNGESTTLTVNLPAGEYTGYCTVPGHREAGMVITIIAE